MNSLPRCIAVAALDADGGLGLRGDLPWHLPADLKHFAKTTRETRESSKQNAVIMGRVTCESIPERYWPLPGRRNIVISRNREFAIEGAEVFSNLATALVAVAPAVESLFIVGGGQMYSEAIKIEACDELILTQIERSFGCDTFFPTYREAFERSDVLASGDHEGLRYTIERWIRRAAGS